MEYKLYKGYIIGPAGQNLAYGPAYGDYRVEVFSSKEDVSLFHSMHVADNEWEAQLWVNRRIGYGNTGEGTATQAEVDELNFENVPEWKRTLDRLSESIVMQKYPGHIMQKVRQRLGLELNDTSRDADINNMSHDEVFDACLRWEGVIGYLASIRSWIEDIYGVKLT